MYRITYIIGNGYQCSCCRETSIYTDDYEDNEYDEMCRWIIEKMADKKMPSYEDADDFYIESIERELGKNIENDIIRELSPQIEAEIERRKFEKIKAEDHKIRAKEFAEKQKLKELLEKYGLPEEYNG